MKGVWVGYDVGCTIGLTLGHGAWQIDRPSNGSMWNSYSFQPVGQWMGYSFTDLGVEGCCRSLNALFVNIAVFSCDQAALRIPLSVCPSVHLSVSLSVTPSSLWSCHRIIMKFQELLPLTKVMFRQKFKIRGQRSRSQRSKPNLAVSGL